MGKNRKETQESLTQPLLGHHKVCLLKQQPPLLLKYGNTPSKTKTALPELQ